MKSRLLRLNAGTGIALGAIGGAMIALLVQLSTGDAAIWSWALPVGVGAGLALGAGAQLKGRNASQDIDKRMAAAQRIKRPP